MALNRSFLGFLGWRGFGLEWTFRFTFLGSFFSSIRIDQFRLSEEIVQLLNMIRKWEICKHPDESCDPEDPEELVTDGFVFSSTELFVYVVEYEG